MFADPFVRLVLSCLLVVFFIAMCLPAAGALYVVLATGGFTRPESDLVLWVIGVFRNFAGLPEAVTAPILQLVQAALSVLCFVEGKTILSWLGRIVFLLVIAAIIGSVSAMLMIEPASMGQMDNVSGGADTLTRLDGAAFYTFTSAITYLGLLTGFTFVAAKK